MEESKPSVAPAILSPAAIVIGVLVAVGAAGVPGVKLNANDERDAIDGAVADCRSRDRNCRAGA